MKRRMGDRGAATLARKIDSMRCIMPLMYLSRCDNGASISESVGLTSAMQWLERFLVDKVDF